MITRYRTADLDSVLRAVTRLWDDVLGTVQVRTPDRTMDLLLNRWLLYQTLSCRVWARAACYQVSGAYGSLTNLGVVKFASRHTFLIDPSGKVAKAYTSVDPGRHSEEVLAALDQLQKE